MIDNLTIGEAKEISRMFAGQPASATVVTGKHIVILDRGFVYVGDVRMDDQFCIITNAQNIRVWGTTKGLGELRDGPTSSTKCDDTGTVKAPARAVIALIECSSDTKW
jgi:hypothetical protein